MIQLRRGRSLGLKNRVLKFQFHLSLIGVCQLESRLGVKVCAVGIRIITFGLHLCRTPIAMLGGQQEGRLAPAIYGVGIGIAL